MSPGQSLINLGKNRITRGRWLASIFHFAGPKGFLSFLCLNQEARAKGAAPVAEPRRSAKCGRGSLFGPRNLEGLGAVLATENPSGRSGGFDSRAKESLKATFHSTVSRREDLEVQSANQLNILNLG